MSGRPRRPLTPEDARLWAKVAATCTPRPGRRAPTPPAEPISAPAPSDPTRRRPLPAPERPRRAGPPPPADLSGERRVRRGDVPIAAHLDLHGLTVRDAHAELHDFLARACDAGVGWVVVVTGKGDPEVRRYGHDTPGVLRRMFPIWLAEPSMRGFVSGFAPAHRRHGGGGAWYVRIRRASR